MRKFWIVAIACAVVTGTAIVASAASESSIAQKAALAACQAHDGKKVTVAVTVDGDTTRYSYKCSKLIAAETTTTTAPPPYTPVPTDFQIGIVILEQQCFGSAGCLVDFRIDVKYIGAQPPAPGKTFEVIYTVTGGESPKTNRFKITGSQVTYPAEESLQTPPNPVLTAAATNVLDAP